MSLILLYIITLRKKARELRIYLYQHVKSLQLFLTFDMTNYVASFPEQELPLIKCCTS